MIDTIPRGILVAPDKFKGTFSAIEVADAIAAGIRDAGREARPLPVADGGEGTARALAAALGGEQRAAQCHDPFGREIRAEFALLADSETAAIDAASASGLALLDPEERDPWRASTAGTGELILAAAAAGVSTVVVGAGGTATVDGGAGAAEVLRGADRLPRLVVACDVRTPWERAAAVFGPQKGANPEMVDRLARRLDEIAASAPRDPRGVEMTGCGGGLSGGLWAHFGAELAPGADHVLEAIAFDAAAAEAEAVVTGEGTIDSQTLEGKAVSAVAARARALGIPCDAVVAVDRLTASDRERLGLRRIVEAGTLEELRAAGERLVADADEGSDPMTAKGV